MNDLQLDKQASTAIITGLHERHLRRKDGSPLFAVPPLRYSEADYAQAHDMDQRELQDFHNKMKAAIQSAIDLPENVASEVVLELRAQLDQLYIRCSSFNPACDQHKQAIRKLIELVMSAIWQAVGNDPQARMELESEEVARQQHCCLLEYPLVADLIRPDTPVAEDELIPTLLQADEDELEAVMWLFDPAQLRDIYRQSLELLEQRQEQGYNLAEAWERLEFIAEHIECECC